MLSDDQYEITWNHDQVFYYRSTDSLHRGNGVTDVSMVEIAILGARSAADDEECYPLGYRDGAMCIEPTLITPANGTENNGRFSFNFSDHLSGSGGALPWDGTWSGRYDGGAKVEISANFDHSLSSSMSQGFFYFSDPSVSSSSLLPVCGASSRRLDTKPSQGIPMARRGEESAFGVDEEGGVGALRGARNLAQGDGYLAASHGLEATANFESITGNSFSFPLPFSRAPSGLIRRLNQISRWSLLGPRL